MNFPETMWSSTVSSKLIAFITTRIMKHNRGSSRIVDTRVHSCFPENYQANHLRRHHPEARITASQLQQGLRPLDSATKYAVLRIFLNLACLSLASKHGSFHPFCHFLEPMQNVTLTLNIMAVFRRRRALARFEFIRSDVRLSLI